jgi:hypothetical protein
MIRTEEKTKLIETNELNFEILVTYTEYWDIKEGSKEEFFGLHRFPDTTLVNIQLESVEVIVKGIGIDILKQLNDKQRDVICWELENC